MLQLEPLIKARLAALPALTGWQVRGGSDATDRRSRPAVDVRCRGAAVTDSNTGRVSVQPQWVISLGVTAGDDAAADVSAAFVAVLSSLQGWAPGNVGGQGWNTLLLVSVQEPDFFPEGTPMVGMQMIFSTTTVYDCQH